MRIVADENLNAQFVKDLRLNGYDLVSIREEYSGISDTEVANLAFLTDCLLISEDKDFGE
jgi:predicted nuclease of predicted toxin-antitoxin system